MALFGLGKNEKNKKETTTQKADDFVVATDNSSKPNRETENKSKKSSLVRVHSLAYHQLVHPLITEKSSLLGAYNQYVFSVAKSATKTAIKKAIEDIYNVKPTKIMIANQRGKKVRTGKNTTGYLKNWKKAIITLPAGQKIDVYEG
ncbi:50S ribosomal protein L23 [Candidatus Kuenenbacteria bacterium]|nr:50S ribosomal protein L23 [Candidatus Kuenenbacteria bacterium]